MDLKKACSLSSAASRVAPSRCLGLRLRSCAQVGKSKVSLAEKDREGGSSENDDSRP